MNDLKEKVQIKNKQVKKLRKVSEMINNEMKEKGTTMQQR